MRSPRPVALPLLATPSLWRPLRIPEGATHLEAEGPVLRAGPDAMRRRPGHNGAPPMLAFRRTLLHG